jgi:hypothetical protein
MGAMAMLEAAAPMNTLDDQERARQRAAMAWTMGAFAAMSLACAGLSRGFLEADACTHYLYARFALHEWHYLVNVWGRPLCTGMYAVPAALAGRHGVQFMSMLLALVCGWSAYRIAANQGYRWPALALIFTLGQPLVFLHSFSELTELPFAAVLGLAFWAYQRRRFLLMTLLVGILPMGRPEGFGFVMLAGVALVAHRRWYGLALLVAPLVLWDYAGWMLYGQSGPWWHWLAANWPYSSDSLYRRGYLLSFVAMLPMLVSPLVLPMTLLGFWQSLGAHDGIGQEHRSAPWLRRLGDAVLHNHRARVQALIAILPAGILVVHSLLYWQGKMASNGELRYLMVVAPLWGLLSAAGWEWVWRRLDWRHPLAWAGAAVLIPPIVANACYRVIPLGMDIQMKQARAAAQWYLCSPIRSQYPRVMLCNPEVVYFMDISPSDPERARPWDLNTVRAAPPGTVMIWDAIYGQYNADARRSVHVSDILAAGWVPDSSLAAALEHLPANHWERDAARANGPWLAFLSPRTASGRATALPATQATTEHGVETGSSANR